MMILLRSSVSMPCPPLPPMLSPAPFVDDLALCPSGKHDISPAQKLIGRIP